jgi:peptidoglycan/xylan/chitin deacetylase (PgdA/CDA1 family)
MSKTLINLCCLIILLGAQALWPFAARAAMAAAPDDVPAQMGSDGSERQISALIELKNKYPHVFIVQGPVHDKKVALTFDDAPDPRYTGKILDVLKAHQVRATFFVIGSRSRQHPEFIRRMARENHVIGNHSYSHAHLLKLGMQDYVWQITATQQIIKQLIGYEPKLLRPPYGDINEEQLLWAADNQFLVVNWNVDSLDWKSLRSEEVMNNVLTDVRPGSIILQHAGGGESEDLSGTIEALPKIIAYLRKQGYQFVTVPELLQVPMYKMNEE